MNSITLIQSTEVDFEETAENAVPAQVVRELSSLELALVGGGTANVVFA